MNRYERKRAEAQQRAHEARLRRDAEERKAGTPPPNTPPLPDDIKRDIAKVVRSIEWTIMDERRRVQGGICFWRAMSGGFTLQHIGIAAKPALGGMIYRAGLDEVRDVVAFCGPGNVGTKTAFGLLAHYFVVSGDDIVDFSPGDWQETYGRGEYADLDLQGRPVDLGPIQWMASPPDFFWAPRKSLEPIPGQMTPELGRAWYTGFKDGDDILWNDLRADATDGLRKVKPHIDSALEFYALKERLWAHQNGHTAIRLSHLAEIVTDRELAARAMQIAGAGKLGDRLIVLRGKADITPEGAAEILTEAIREGS